MLICDEHRRTFEGSLAESGTGRYFPQTTFLHCQITTSGEHVYHIGVDKSAVVVTNIDDYTLLSLIFDVEVDVELIERALAHIRQVNIAELSAADAFDIRSVALDPLTIEQILLGSCGDRF